MIDQDEDKNIDNEDLLPTFNVDNNRKSDIVGQSKENLQQLRQKNRSVATIVEQGKGGSKVSDDNISQTELRCVNSEEQKSFDEEDIKQQNLADRIKEAGKDQDDPRSKGDDDSDEDSNPEDSSIVSSHLVTITERTYEESRTNITSSQVSLSAMMLEDIKQVVRKDLKMKHGEGPSNEKMNEIISNYYVANKFESTGSKLLTEN